jgi:D-arabinose 5-phosphate isomerase GutQ/beta-phosphoglucomutase-like phosphatase (HAD superfamily)
MNLNNNDIFCELQIPEEIICNLPIYYEKYKAILDYDIFIFDFDGTIMDTERYHHKAWEITLNGYFGYDTDYDINLHYKYGHALKKNSHKDWLYYKYGIENYEELYLIKLENYNKLIHENKIEMISGVQELLTLILNNDKKFVIVTNTSHKFIEYFKIKFPIIGLADKIFTKECFIKKKPDPECYFRVSEKYKDLKKIGFEDSLLGFDPLYKINDITPVFIDNVEYYYREKIKNEYQNIICTKNYNLIDLNNKLIVYDEIICSHITPITLNKSSEPLSLYTQPITNINNRININNNDIFIDTILQNNINELEINFKKMHYIINQMTTILQNLDENQDIYLTGMGKSGYVCKKCVSTWQSLSIKCSYIDLPNLPHGDFGQFRDKDILILISNSGNTDEIVNILNYLKTSFNKKIITISIVANKQSAMEELSDYCYILDNIKESDNINMAPSTSNIIFMALLDGIGINLKKMITKDEFKMYHPHGSLGNHSFANYSYNVTRDAGPLDLSKVV